MCVCISYYFKFICILIAVIIIHTQKGFSEMREYYLHDTD